MLLELLLMHELAPKHHSSPLSLYLSALSDYPVCNPSAVLGILTPDFTRVRKPANVFDLIIVGTSLVELPSGILIEVC